MKTLLLSLALLVSVSLLAEEIVIYPTGIATATGPFCGGGNYAGFANYVKERTNGWGYVPLTNGNTLFGAAYTNNPKADLQSVGKSGDTVCSRTNSLRITNIYSSAYRFTAYFRTTNDIPTNINQCGLVLTNFNN